MKDFYDLNLEKSGEGGMKIRVYSLVNEKIKKKFFNKAPIKSVYYRKLFAFVDL